MEDLNLETIKIASPDITNAQLLYNVAKYKVEVILSTGMCVLDDIEFALGVLASAFLSPEKVPTESQIKASVRKNETQRVLREKVTLLHCTSDYPTKLKDVNLEQYSSVRYLWFKGWLLRSYQKLGSFSRSSRNGSKGHRETLDD